MVAPVAFAVDCSPADIVLLTQDEVDDFQLNHGPCDHVVGNLQIGDFPSNITNLFGMSGLVSVGGDFYITRIDATNLLGLNSLEIVGGEFENQATDIFN
jgi:hypothetical protein